MVDVQIVHCGRSSVMIGVTFAIIMLYYSNFFFLGKVVV